MSMPVMCPKCKATYTGDPCIRTDPCHYAVPWATQALTALNAARAAMLQVSPCMAEECRQDQTEFLAWAEKLVDAAIAAAPEAVPAQPARETIIEVLRDSTTGHVFWVRTRTGYSPANHE